MRAQNMYQLDQMVFGVRGAWPNVRRASRAFCMSIAGVHSVQTKCHCVRDVMYANDPRWAVDDEYMRIFPHKKGWWPDELWRRVREQTDRARDSSPDDPSKEPCNIEMARR